MNHIAYINEYLDKELSEAEAISFEQALTTDEALQKAVAQERAIREQFEYERIRQKALALHESKKKEALQDKAMTEQFEYERIRQKALALHEHKKKENTTAYTPNTDEERKTQQQAKIIPLYRRFAPYAVAASVVGLMMMGYWSFTNKSQNFNIVVNPISADSTKMENKENSKQTIENQKVVEQNAPKNGTKKTDTKASPPKEERLSNINPFFDENATDIAMNDFCKDALTDMNLEVMGNENEKSAATFLKKGQYNEAEQLLFLQAEKNDETFFLLALVAIKKKENPKAIQSLQKIKNKSEEVKKVLKEAGF